MAEEKDKQLNVMCVSEKYCLPEALPLVKFIDEEVKYNCYSTHSDAIIFGYPCRPNWWYRMWQRILVGIKWERQDD